MFLGASLFNQPIGSWNVSKVGIMSYMFENANAFNQDLSNWNVSNVYEMTDMFYQANQFDQDLSAWDFRLITDLSGFLSYSNVSTLHVDALLESFAVQYEMGNYKNENITFGAQSLTYCDRAVFDFLVNQKGWSFNSITNDCSDLSNNTFHEQLKIYPNPTSSTITINANFSKAQVYSLSGQLLFSTISKQVDFSSQYPGVYVIHLFDKFSQTVGHLKVVKH